MRRRLRTDPEFAARWAERQGVFEAAITANLLLAHVALLDEERHLDDHAGLQRRRLVAAARGGVATQARNVGNLLRSWQSGSIRTYASWVVIGSVIIMLIVSVAGGVR